MKRLTATLVFSAALLGSAFAAQPASYNVFFVSGSAQLTPDGNEIVASAANTIRHARNAKVIISAGDPRWGEARFHSVQAALVARGVDNSRIVRAGMAASPIVDNPVLLNRVEIRVQTNRPLETAMSY